jgi:hypothetical protein
MDVVVASTGRCSGIRAEKLAEGLKGDRIVFSRKAATLGHQVEAR